jgi:hypothetical protein
VATRTVLLSITDLRGGRNGVDSPMLLEPDQCVEAINVDWLLGLIGRKRKGAASVFGVPSVGALHSLVRHIDTEESDNELWAFDNAGGIRRLVAGAWESKTLPVPSLTDPLTVVGVSFNGKLFLAYPNQDGLLHVWDGTTLRVVGLGQPGGGAPVLASVTAAAGTGITGYRGYHAMYVVASGGVVSRRSGWHVTPKSATLANNGGWVITRGALLNQGETHWELYGSAATGVANNDPGPTI